MRIIGTARAGTRTDLHALTEQHPAQVERLDIDKREQIASVRSHLSGRTLDMLIVNAGTTNRVEHVRIGDVSTEEFTGVMVTNAPGPMHVVEVLQDLVAAEGLIGTMSSGQGSIANNEKGMREVYRVSKAALNMPMRGFAARETARPRAFVLMAPGWILTDLGASDAPGDAIVATSGVLSPETVTALKLMPGEPFKL